MKSSATATLTADDAPTSSSDPVAACSQPGVCPENSSAFSGKYHSANAEGVFENPEQVFVPLHAGNICHFLLARTAEGWAVGYKFFTRQPHNLVQSLPKESDPARFYSRQGALSSVCDIAEQWFGDHGAALARLKAWRAEAFGAGSEPSAADAAIALAFAQPEVTAVAVPPAADSVSVSAPVHGRYAAIAVDDIELGNNPRKSRSPEKFAELVESIRSEGELLQPIAVQDMGAENTGKRYRLIFGEGRYLGVKQLGWSTVDAKVYTGIDATAVRIKALIENLQREDLNDLDQAEEFSELKEAGLTTADLAHRTGKTERAIRYVVALMKLPATVRELIRSGEITPRHARSLLPWVVPPGSEHTEANKNFVPRPRVCEIIAEAVAKSAGDISGRELEENPVPTAALAVLVAEKLVAEIPGKYWGRINEFENEDSLIHQGGKFYTFATDEWKAAKKKLDAEDRAKATAAAEKVAAKVTNQVSVPVADLQRGKVKVVELIGADEIYADYLPPGACAQAIAENKAEVMVCLKPELLTQLKDAEAKALAEDAEKCLTGARERATAKIKKLRRIGARELALIVDYATISSGTCICPSLDGGSFKTQGVRPPKNLTREALAGMDPITLLRVFLQGALAAADGQKNERELLRWILATPKLGLISEDPKARQELLAQLSERLFGAADEQTTASAAKPPAKKSPKKKGGRK